MNFFEKSKTILFLLVILSASYFAYFFHLSALPLRLWDESRLAVNALEMCLNENYLVTSYNGQPDMWSTKPPFTIWAMVLLMKVFGYNELAVRLPSAIAALLTTIFLYLFLVKYFNNHWAGFWSALVLITSVGFVGEHVARTGDYDSMLVLFIFLYAAGGYLFIESGLKKYLFLFAFFLICATLTKGIAGLLFIPALFIYSVYRKRLVFLIKNKFVYLSLALFLVVSLGYYLLREMGNPGYIQAVNENELGGRFLNTIENHKHPFSFYLSNFFMAGTNYGILANARFLPWIFLLPFCFVFSLFEKNKEVKKFIVFCWICLLSYFLVISSAQTKLAWYDAPMYPFFAAIIGLSIHSAFEVFFNNIGISKFKKHTIALVFTVLLFDLPGKKILSMVYKPHDENEFKYQYRDFFEKIKSERPEINEFIVLNSGYNPDLFFYAEVLKSTGFNIKISDIPGDTISYGKTLVICMPEIRERILKNYFTEELISDRLCNCYLVKGIKN